MPKHDTLGKGYAPCYLLSRGDTAESIHFGAIAVVMNNGEKVAWHGDPGIVTFLRSTAKPFQALPFIAQGGDKQFHLTKREIAILCASHSGTDVHKANVESIQAKIGVAESDLLCGTHPPFDAKTAESMQQRGEEPTPNRHNCSGKHTGMLAFARMLGAPSADYIARAHPVQLEILRAFAEMTHLSPKEIAWGIDGCSAPNFAIPLYNAALAYARLVDPGSGSRVPEPYAQACQKITSAMTAYPDMVGGPGRFDTRLMESTGGKIVAKGGAEGYQGIGIAPDVLEPGSPALGIAIKISDGDQKSRARSAVTLEVLRQLGALTPTELDELAEFGPTKEIYNWRKLTVGLARPCFTLQRAAQ